MQELIEDHLGEPVTLVDLARAARYSMYHSARMFKEITGRTPFEYLRMRRLSAAALELNAKERRVVDVAFDFVFDSHEGFTRAFARQFSVPPSRLREVAWPAHLFHPGLATEVYRDRQKGNMVMSETAKGTQQTQVVFVQILERPRRKLLFLPGRSATHYFAYCEEVGCGVWEDLKDIREAIHEPMGMWLPESIRPEGTSTYVQGVEVAADYAGPVPAGYRVIELAPCRMLVFQGEPFDEKDFEQAITSLWEVMNKYDPQAIGYEWADEDAPRFQLAPMGYRGYIEGRPVRQLSATA
ncbi:MAG: helix-turn-helix domain-containing protein [Gaiellales bacterium]|nr:helix-turn-helix domain-containing protein [Gaiellales bacterium]